jgi:hypothetical protein
VNLNVAAAAFYRPGVLHDLINSFYSNRGRADPRELSSFLKGVKVLTKYVKEKGSDGKLKEVIKTKTIWGLAPNGANSQQVKFSWQDDAGAQKNTTVQEYFRQSMFSSQISYLASDV